jgi:hypothetical protein
VADWGQKAKDKDRDDAIKVIEDAAARGQIVDVDKLKRIQEVQAASTVGEIELVTRGLAAAPAVGATDMPASPPPVSDPAPPANPTFQQYTPPVTPPVTEPDPTPEINLPPTNVQYGEPLTPSAGTPVATPPMITKGGGGKWVLLIVLIVMAGVALPVFFGIKAIVDTVNDGIDDISGPGNADVFSEDGLEELADDLESARGSTEIFSATLYPGYAVLEVPAEDQGKRMYRYYWDGELDQQSKGTVSEPQRMDLRDVELDVVEDLRTKIRAEVEDADPATNYVIVSAPGPTDEGAYLSAYASNDFGEGGYISADLDGKVIRTTTW